MRRMLTARLQTVQSLNRFTGVLLVVKSILRVSQLVRQRTPNVSRITIIIDVASHDEVGANH